MREVENRIGYAFGSRRYLEEALRHASVADDGDSSRSYQRLEFLGDGVLNLCVAEEMYRRLPDAGEGKLSKARSAIINNRNLVRVGERIGVRESIRTDPSLRGKGGGVTRKMIADAVEAIVGAIFLDGGFAEARRFVQSHFLDDPRAWDLVPDFDAKSRLQELCQKRRIPLPTYRIVETSGPPHSRAFSVTACLYDGTEAGGKGSTRKEAETEAAGRLLSLLEERESGR